MVRGYFGDTGREVHAFLSLLRERETEREREREKKKGQETDGLAAEENPVCLRFYKKRKPPLAWVWWFPMAIQEKMMQAAVEYRLHLALAAALVAALFSLLSLGPSFSAVAGFFWPLLVSTGFLLVAVAVLLRISPPPGETSGEELINYVAGRPEDGQLARDYYEAADGVTDHRREEEAAAAGAAEHRKSQ
ncbi:hypothetical protein B296_00020378 [Ensete ventricosum]|uniref:Uncharacterized protein n=1 Tax=Ensete ventricosum TaxID=4639 RepID=A0A426ZQ40_ENSVE|nr:hypothetical protein B296_00020378 [Ensete ventricosum]